MHKALKVTRPLTNKKSNSHSISNSTLFPLPRAYSRSEDWCTRCSVLSMTRKKISKKKRTELVCVSKNWESRIFWFKTIWSSFLTTCSNCNKRKKKITNRKPKSSKKLKRNKFVLKRTKTNINNWRNKRSVFWGRRSSSSVSRFSCRRSNNKTRMNSLSWKTFTSVLKDLKSLTMTWNKAVTHKRRIWPRLTVALLSWLKKRQSKKCR